MVLADLGQGWWAAFNPRTASVDMVWRGTVDWRGKVYDFSQGNSRASGQIVLTRLTPIASMEHLELSSVAPHAQIAGLDLTSFATAYIAFDEQRRTPVRCTLAEVSESAQSPLPLLSFESSTSYTSDTEWMWNFKQVAGSVCARARHATLEFDSAARAKPLRNVRVYGERIAWRSDAGAPLPVAWRGYSLNNGVLTLRVAIGSSPAELHMAALADGRGVLQQWSGSPAGATLDGEPAPAQRVVVAQETLP